MACVVRVWSGNLVTAQLGIDPRLSNCRWHCMPDMSARQTVSVPFDSQCKGRVTHLPGFVWIPLQWGLVTFPGHARCCGITAWCTLVRHLYFTHLCRFAADGVLAACRFCSVAFVS
jgi:hypothetical protein